MMFTNGGSLLCDNFDDCEEYVREAGSQDQTKARARALGWHMFEGTTIGGAQVQYCLGPSCVGQRTRLPRAPQVLPGQEQLF